MALPPEQARVLKALATHPPALAAATALSVSALYARTRDDGKPASLLLSATLEVLNELRVKGLVKCEARHPFQTWALTRAGLKAVR